MTISFLMLPYNLFPDEPSSLYDQTILSYNQARAPGTVKNKLVQAQLYLKFCLPYIIDFLHPSVLDVAMYTRFLGNSFSSPATIRNYLSGAKAWVGHHLGSVQAFSASEPGDVLKKVSSSLNHVPVRAYPLSPSDIALICEFLDDRPSLPLAIKPCVLLAYASFLRASNLTAPSMSVWSGPHTLKGCDIIDNSEGLCIVVRSTKTRARRAPVFLQVFPAESPALCPVIAWRRYKLIVDPPPFGPAFIYNDTMPLTPRPIVALMRLALSSAGLPYAPRVTMHSLRRGGAQCAAASGASQEQLMDHGTWSSASGLKPYISEDQRIIPRIIAQSLA